MKKGNTVRSIERPNPGFTINREGYRIYIQYIPENSIHVVDADMNDDLNIENHTEFEFIMYSNSISVKTYEKLINEMILLLYSNEDELGMINSTIISGISDTYNEYREYVLLCKNTAQECYESLGLVKEEY